MATLRQNIRFRDTEVARNRLDDLFDPDPTRLATVLEQMEQTPEGREVMKAYSKVARYDRIEGDALKGLEEARRIWLRRNGGAS